MELTDTTRIHSVSFMVEIFDTGDESWKLKNLHCAKDHWKEETSVFQMMHGLNGPLPLTYWQVLSQMLDLIILVKIMKKLSNPKVS